MSVIHAEKYAYVIVWEYKELVKHKNRLIQRASYELRGKLGHAYKKSDVFCM